jgi:hypothetical protein
MKRVVVVYAGLLVVFGLVICLALEWGQLSSRSRGEDSFLFHWGRFKSVSRQFVVLVGIAGEYRGASGPAFAAVHCDFASHPSCRCNLSKVRATGGDRRNDGRNFAWPIVAGLALAGSICVRVCRGIITGTAVVQPDRGLPVHVRGRDGIGVESY